MATFWTKEELEQDRKFTVKTIAPWLRSYFFPGKK